MLDVIQSSESKMHPRNIYKNKVDFNELAKTFPEFAKVSHLDISGKVKIDFKNPDASRCFTKCCLKKDFNLDLTLPPDKLLPTIPLRLNYLLWIDDLLSFCGISEVSGIDIGCGASCIYCLLAVRLNPGWHMFALEINDVNMKFAKDNISSNNLEEQVVLISQESSPNLFERLFQQSSPAKSFCMCNPPFFSSVDESLGENRTGKRKAPKSLLTGSTHELIFNDGGELGFVNKILQESFELKEKIEIYSTMFGCKKNMQKFMGDLRGKKVENFTTTEFVQGNTVRWGVAWSFKYDLKTFKDHHVLEKEKAAEVGKNVLRHDVQLSFNEAEKILMKIFNDLKIQLKSIKESKDDKTWELIATQNTWSNQRKRKRAKMRGEKLEDEEQIPNQSLHIGFELKAKDGFSEIRMFYISGTMNKDCVNQILQFIKNKIR